MTNKLKNRKIVLYGLSTETERVINEWNGEYDIIGLLDGYKTSGEQFGYPIFDINDVVKIENVIIIVVARPGSCKAIAKRIGNLCRENNIELLDIRGKDLLVNTEVVYNFSSIPGYTKADVIKSVDEVDVVSFDLFDTLLVRDVLSPTDVFDILNCRLIEKGINISEFIEKRTAIEKKQSQGHAPRLVSIYEEILENEGNEEVTAAQIAELEYRLDTELVSPRQDMVELIKNIKSNGKKIYITSESFYSEKQIYGILNHIGISDIDGLLVSCEYDTGKTGDLFDYLIKSAGTNKILHIGDDIVADVESANRHGLKSFQIYSSSELLDKLGGLGLVSGDMNLSDRIRTGMFIANMFNSPFQFEDDKRRIHVNSSNDIGYLFAAPLIIDFTKWFGEQVKRYNLSNIWFSARDGYLLQKLYNKLYKGSDSEYFLTSRISAIRAGMDDISDVEYVDSMKYSGDVISNLKTRFGIDEETLKMYPEDDSKDGLLKYADAIMHESKEKKLNTQKYIQKLNINRGRIAFFDFVSKGTCQMYAKRYVDNEIKGLYFLQLEPEFMRNKDLDIMSFYKEEEKDDSAIFENYYILETLLTAPHPTIAEFDANGNPVYATETRTKEDVACFMSAQEGILAYADRYLSICPQSEFRINKKSDESMLMLLKNVEIRDKDFLSLTVEDPFFNRMTDIKDVL